MEANERAAPWRALADAFEAGAYAFEAAPPHTVSSMALLQPGRVCAISMTLTALAVAAPVHEHHCQHDRVQRSAAGPIIAPQRHATRRRRVQAASPPPPLRIVFRGEPLVGDEFTCYEVGQTVRVGTPEVPGNVCAGEVQDNCYLTCTADHILNPTREQQLRQRLLQAVAAWFGAALKPLQPVEGPLVVLEGACGFGGAIAIPESFRSEGSTDTDVLIFVTSRPILGSALAFAGHCQEDAGSAEPYVPRRPIMGHINIDPTSLGDPSLWLTDSTHAQTVDSILKVSSPRTSRERLDAHYLYSRASIPCPCSTPQVLIHETMHVLGFTYEKIVQFPCPESPSFNRFQSGTAEP